MLLHGLKRKVILKEIHKSKPQVRTLETFHTFKHFPGVLQAIMQFTRRLLQRSLSITLFTRANCSLCEDAKLVVQTVGRKKSFGYSEIDVMAAGQKEWKDCYEFDVPVVRHLRKTSNKEI